MKQLQTTDTTSTWRVHPASRRIAVAVLVVSIVASIAALIGVLMESLWWAILAATFLTYTLRRFFFPTVYTIDADGILAECAGGRKQFRWSEIRRFLYDSRGGFLSTRANRSCLDAWSGMHLEFGEDPDLVVARIEVLISVAAIGTERKNSCNG